jgi:hypothetical protein
MVQRRDIHAKAWLCLLILGPALVAACAAAPGEIALNTAEFDFGTIPNNKPVSQAFQVRNVGRGELEITGVSTSCGCTTAEIDDHELAPGQAANLKISYDPQAHGGATGEFMRMVYVRSNDPDTPETALTIRVTVVEPQ